MIRLADHISVRGRYMRSVNLERDSELASSLGGYIMTPRATTALEQVLQAYSAAEATRAWTLTGVYGTGKSALANLLAALFAPRSSPIRQEALKVLRADGNTSIATKLARAIPTEGCIRALAVSRREPLAHTLVRALARGAEAFWSNRPGPKPSAVHRALSLREGLRANRKVEEAELPELVADLAAASGSGLLIILDELGKLLEFAANSGGGADLYLLQQLAELPSNRDRGPVLLLGLLHQNFGEYGNLLSSSERAEWEKVHGRFEDIPFDESGEQMLRLIGEAVESSLPANLCKAVRQNSAAWDRAFVKNLPQPYVTDVMSVERIERVYPLHPLAALVLPLLCSRYAQNDRSLFTFLASTGANGFSSFLEQRSASSADLPLLRICEVYDYFLNFAAIGGSRVNHWSEIHAVISDARGLTPGETEALKTIGVFNLIAGAGPLRASHEIVLAALSIHPDNKEERQEWMRTLQRLQDQRIITYRQQVDEYRIWQGSDFDVEGSIVEQIAADGRSLSSLLDELAPLGPVIAQRHSYRTGTLRYFERQYQDDPDRLDAISSDVKGSDGVVLYWMGDGEPPSVPAKTSDGKPLVVVQLTSSRGLEAAARELMALLAIERREPTLQTDGVARREVRHRIVIARERLDDMLRESLEGNSSRSHWFEGEPRTVQNFNAELSFYCDEVFHRGPVLWNELINRRELTSQGARARRELIAGLLSNPEARQLGIEGSGPELSMYDSLLGSTGIHRQQDGAYVIAPPESSGVQALWHAIEGFCLSSTEKPRPISELYAVLEQPPYGARRGTIPVLLAAVLLYHNDDVSVYQDGSFLPILRPSHFELLVKDPARFAVKHFALSGLRREVFRELESLLKSGGAKRPATARNATLLTVVRPLVRFATDLPPVTRNAEHLSEAATAVRDALLGVKEPDRLLFEALPVAVGMVAFTIDESSDSHRHERFRKALFEALRELQLYYERLLGSCRDQIRNAFGMLTDTERFREDLRVRASYLVGKVIEPRLRSLVLAAVDDTASDDKWLASLVMIVADRPADSWTKDDALAFEMNVAEMARRFINLEALQTRAVRDGVEGFEARLITVTEPTGDNIHRLVWVDHRARATIEHIAARLIEDLQKLATSEHQQHAILITMLEQLLEPPRSTTSKAVDSHAAEGRKHA